MMMSNKKKKLKAEKVKKVVKGLAKISNRRKKAQRNKKVKTYIRNAWSIARQTLFTGAILLSIFEGLEARAEEIEVEEVGSDDLEQGDIEFLDSAIDSFEDPELLDAIRDVFQCFDELDDFELEYEGLIVDIVEQIDVDDFNDDELDNALYVVNDICNELGIDF